MLQQCETGVTDTHWLGGGGKVHVVIRTRTAEDTSTGSAMVLQTKEGRESTNMREVGGGRGREMQKKMARR